MKRTRFHDRDEDVIDVRDKEDQIRQLPLVKLCDNSKICSHYQHLRHRHFLRQEAMDMLVFNAQKLNNAVKETVRAAEAASIRVR